LTTKTETQNYTVSRKGDTELAAVTPSVLNWFSKFFHRRTRQ